MKRVTREYVLEVIKTGISLHGGKAAFERAANLPAGHIKDIEKWSTGGKSQGTEIPRADRWQRMLEAVKIIEEKIEDQTEVDRIITEINSAFQKIGARIDGIEKKINPSVSIKRSPNDDEA